MEVPAERINKEDLEGIRPKLEPVASASSCGCPVKHVITPQRPPFHNGAMAVGSDGAPAQVAKKIKEEDLEQNGESHRDKEGHVIFVVDIRKEHIFAHNMYR